MAATAKTSAVQAILAAVDRLLGEIGYERLTVEDVARTAGVSRRTFYVYFTGKDQATLACLDRNIDRLVEACQRIADAPGSSRSRLEEILRFRVRYLHDIARHQQAVNDEIYGQLRPLYMPRRERYLAAESAALVHVLEAGRGAGVMRFDDSGETALMLLLATNSFLPFGLSAGQLRRRAELGRRVAVMVELLLRGLDVGK